MKKITTLFIAMLCLISLSFAQTKTVVAKDEVKTKKTTTIGQKVHNVFSKHKKYSGTKTKHVVKTAKVKA